MAMPVKDFLLLYFRQRHFNGMPDAVRAQFNDYAKKDDFRGDMKSWKRDLIDSNNPTRKKAEPDANTELDQSGWKSLFKSLQDAFRNMDANKNSFASNTDAMEFLNKYFGHSFKLFSATQVAPNTITEIDRLMNSVIANNYTLFRSTFKNHEDFESFVSDVNQQKYQKDLNVREKLETILSNLAYQLRFGGIKDPSLEQQLSQFDFDAIIDGLNPETTVSKQDINKLKLVYRDILNTLHDKQKVYDVFKQFDNGKISGQLDEAIKKTDYTGEITPKDKVPPKRQDKKNLLQTIEGKWNETYDDVLKKYLTAHRDHIYIKPTAKTIVGALTGAGIKPTDGIKAILDNKGKIAEKLQYKSPSAAEHFDWFVKTMEDFQKTMPKAFEGALRNGRQMNRLVEEMALKAIDEGKIDAVKTAMEVLSVMRYALFDSRTRQAIKNTDFTIFSDKGLSWNKNEGIQFVTSALDKTLKKGTQIVAFAASGVANGIRRIGTKFNHSGQLQNKSEQWEIDNENAKNAAERAKRRENRDDRAEIKRLRQEKRATGITNVTKAKKDLRLMKQDEDAKRQTYETAAQNFAPFEEIKNDHDVQEQFNIVTQEIADLRRDLSAMPNPATNQLQQTEADEKRQQLAEKTQKLTELQTELNNINGKYAQRHTTLAAEYNRIFSVSPSSGLFLYDEARNAALNAKNDLDAAERATTTQQANIDKYIRCRDEISLYNKNIRDRNAAFNRWDETHKNQYLELMAYWDYLQTGNTKNIFRLRTSALQKKMDGKEPGHSQTRMQEQYLWWKQQHGYAA